MQYHDLNNFWNNISLLNKSKSTLANCINGTTGEGDIANLWKNFYNILLNRCEDDSSIECLAGAVANVADSDRCCNPKVPSSIPAGGKDFP